MKTSDRKKHYKLHAMRFSWFSFMIVGLLLLQFAHNFQATGDVKVLAYATSVSRNDLHSLTNQQRSAHSLPELTLNDTLSQAAQAKANHMVTHDYWAHVAPDGTTPWYFFDQAGYKYLSAGENLAYGFLTSSGAVEGWMNSPGHRANILGEYKDVGFGFANSASYQGGENTVIVALYGTSPVINPPAAPASPAAPVPPQSAPLPPTPPTIGSDSPSNSPSTPIGNEPTPTTIQAESHLPQPAITGLTEPSRQADLLPVLSASITSQWTLFGSMIIIAIASIGYITTHIRLARHCWETGKKYMVTHPLTDAAVAGSVIVLFVTASGGYIQ